MTNGVVCAMKSIVSVVYYFYDTRYMEHDTFCILFPAKGGQACILYLLLIICEEFFHEENPKESNPDANNNPYPAWTEYEGNIVVVPTDLH